MNVLDIIKMNIKSYRFVTCCMEPDNNILFCNYHENMHVDIKIAEELVNNRLDFTKNMKHYLISRFSPIRYLSYEAIQYLKDPENGLKNILGAAFVVNDTASAEVAEIFIRSYKKFPARCFDSEIKAIKWIGELKEFHNITQQ